MTSAKILFDHLRSGNRLAAYTNLLIVKHSGFVENRHDAAKTNEDIEDNPEIELLMTKALGFFNAAKEAKHKSLANSYCQVCSTALNQEQFRDLNFTEEGGLCDDCYDGYLSPFYDLIFGLDEDIVLTRELPPRNQDETAFDYLTRCLFSSTNYSGDTTDVGAGNVDDQAGFLAHVDVWTHAILRNLGITHNIGFTNSIADEISDLCSRIRSDS